MVLLLLESGEFLFSWREKGQGNQSSTSVYAGYCLYNALIIQTVFLVQINTQFMQL